MNILGIHDGHNASVALIRNGYLLRILQEERYSRVKNQGGFPFLAVEEILSISGLAWSDIDLVSFSTKKYRNSAMLDSSAVHKVFDEMFRGTHHAQCSGSSTSEYNAESEQYERTAFLRQVGYTKTIKFVEHHLCHASTTFYGTPAGEHPCLVFTCDGQGDGLSATVHLGDKNALTRIGAVHRDDSVAQIFSFVTFLLGFRPLEHEYKLMGLAPYAEESINAAEIAQWFRSLFTFDAQSPYTWGREIGVPRSELMPAFLQQELKFRRFDDVAAGLQRFYEYFMLEWILGAVRSSGVRRIALCGGGFMNVKLNGKISMLDEIDNIFVFPSCGDESNSVGAAFQALSDVGELNTGFLNVYGGRKYTDKECLSAVTNAGDQLVWCEPQCINSAIASLLADGNIVARFAGAAEFGARALGNRSILADPRKTELIDVLNKTVKNRDFWMPFAATVLAPEADRLLHRRNGMDSPYMMFTFPVTEEGSYALASAIHPRDKTCRAQILSVEQNSAYYDVIDKFAKITHIPALLNTSFNLHGEPIVESPEDALRVFNLSGLKYMALGPYLLTKP